MGRFAKILKERNIEVRESRGWTNTNCPFCRSPIDTHCNGGFSETVPAYNCWRCGKHNWAQALSLILKVSPIEAKRLVGDTSSEKMSRKKANGKNLSLPGFETLTEREMSYLEGRGFDVVELQKKFGIRGGGIAGEWSYRIIIPIFYEGELVSWTGRSILSKEQINELNIPRYKNLSVEASAINPKDVLFNIDNCRSDSAIMVEGPFDVLKMGDDCCCSLGTSVTNAQKLLLSKRFKKVFLAFDNEPAAQEKARKLGREIYQLGIEVEVVDICGDFGKNDPGELSKDQVVRIKEELEFSSI